MKRTKEEAQITKERIIENAMALFIQNGYSNTTLEEIAQRANVTRGAIYWHFEDKLDIAEEVIKNEHERLAKLLSRLFSEDVAPFLKLRKIIEGIVKHFFEFESFRNLIELTWFKMEYTQLAEIQNTKVELTKYFITNFERVVREAQSDGSVKTEISHTDIAITITNMINGLYRLYFILPDKIKNKEEAMNSFTTYLELIKK